MSNEGEDSRRRAYDVVIVGGGVVGAVFGKVLAELAYRERRAISILILEAGRGAGLTASSHQAYLDKFYQASIKSPNSPYPYIANAPYEDDLSFLKPPQERYYRQLGPHPFGSNTTRALGGTTLHWMGIALRMLPADFQLKSRYGCGVDWPLSYTALRPFYEKAEWELGVSGDHKEQMRVLGSEDGLDAYEYPMRPIPVSHLDRSLAASFGEEFHVGSSGEAYPVRLVPLPQARNSNPASGCSDPRDYMDAARKNSPFRPYGAPEDPVTGPGQRCEGNASCIPICPSRAKYTALKTIQQLKDLSKMPGISIEIVTAAVATSLDIDTAGRVTQLNYLHYDDEQLAYAEERNATARRFVLAASAIENAKLLLASRTESCPGGLANESGLVGRNLMDHPFVLAWGLSREQVLGAFRGPGATSDLPMRDGRFRTEEAAFRTDVGNWGWGLTDDAPTRDLERLIHPEAFHALYDERAAYFSLLPRSALMGRDLRDKIRDVVHRQVTLGFLMEQLPERRNRVLIDDDWRDQLGVHKPVIEYTVSEYTTRGAVSALKLAEEVFRQANVEDYTDHSLPTALGTTLEWAGKRFKYIGAGHIMGTHTMGKTRGESVVDEYQRSWAHDNLYVVGCGSMPTAGTSNPTLTAVALSIRSAENMFTGLGLPRA